MDPITITLILLLILFAVTLTIVAALTIAAAREYYRYWRLTRGPEHRRPDVQPRHPVEDEPELPPLRVGVRILLFALGSFLVLFGVIFGPLPLIPAIVLVPAGVALLSLASNRLNQRLRTFVMRHWPNAWRRIQRVRAWLHRRLS